MMEQQKKTGEKQVVVKEDCDSFDIMPESEANAKGKGAVLASKIDKFVVSFSGGKDSQVLLDLVARVVPNTDFLVILRTLPKIFKPLFQAFGQFFSAVFDLEKPT